MTNRCRCRCCSSSVGILLQWQQLTYLGTSNGIRPAKFRSSPLDFADRAKSKLDRRAAQQCNPSHATLLSARQSQRGRVERPAGTARAPSISRGASIGRTTKGDSEEGAYEEDAARTGRSRRRDRSGAIFFFQLASIGITGRIIERGTAFGPVLPQHCIVRYCKAAEWALVGFGPTPIASGGIGVMTARSC